MTIWAFDIETDTSGTSLPGGPPPGLDPRVGRVTSIAVASDTHAWVLTHPDEAHLISMFSEWLLLDIAPDDIIATWNGGAFDWPYVAHRAALRNVHLPATLTAHPNRKPKYEPLPTFPAGVAAVRLGAGHHVDIAVPYKSWAARRGVRWSLKDVAAEAGFPAMTSGTGADVGDLDPAHLAAYNLSDSWLTLRLARRIRPMLTAHADHRPGTTPQENTP